MEQFEGFSHQEIHDQVGKMKPRLMHEVADVYDSVANSLSGGLLGAHLAIQRELSDGMEGQFADAANQATRTFYEQATDVQEVIRAVGLRIEAAAFAAEVVQKSVPAPPTQAPVTTNTAVTTTVVDPAQVAQTVVGAADPAAAAAFDRYKEDQRLAAVEVMNTTYKPTYQPAGDGVPTFVPVQIPGDRTDDPGPGGPSSGGPGGAPAGSGPAGETPGTETSGEDETAADTSETAVTEEDSQTTTAGTNETPSTRQPNSTTTGVPTGDPQRTTPSTTTTGSPSVPAGTPSGTPGSPSGTPQNQSPGRTVPGTPGAPGVSTTTAAAASTAAGTSRAMSGMPGMMSGAAGRRGEDDAEHTTPDYLVRDREEELFGPRIATLGGVLGADVPAAQPAEDRGERR
ncbi:hypothetical protein [Nocardia sp. X0981]